MYSYDRTAERKRLAMVSRPTPSEVLYTAPNPDGSRKLCENCCLWVEETERCVIHAKDLSISAKAVCGYHVFGKPLSKRTADGFRSVEAVKPELSGLAKIAGGTSCNTCQFFTGSDSKGTCEAVADPEDQEQDAEVQGLGCCSRWSS